MKVGGGVQGFFPPGGVGFPSTATGGVKVKGGVGVPSTASEVVVADEEGVMACGAHRVSAPGEKDGEGVIPLPGAHPLAPMTSNRVATPHIGGLIILSSYQLIHWYRPMVS